MPVGAVSSEPTRGESWGRGSRAQRAGFLSCASKSPHPLRLFFVKQPGTVGWGEVPLSAGPPAVAFS